MLAGYYDESDHYVGFYVREHMEGVRVLNCRSGMMQRTLILKTKAQAAATCLALSEVMKKIPVMATFLATRTNFSISTLTACCSQQVPQ